MARRLFWRCKNQPGPPDKETKTTYRSNRAQPAEICKRKQIQAPAKQQNPDEEQPACAAIDGPVKRKHEKRNCVYELIKDRLVPNIEHSARLQSRPQTMRPERAKRHCYETKQRCDPK
jgi:hypothetical protein